MSGIAMKAYPECLIPKYGREENNVEFFEHSEECDEHLEAPAVRETDIASCEITELGGAQFNETIEEAVNGWAFQRIVVEARLPPVKTGAKGALIASCKAYAFIW